MPDLVVIVPSRNRPDQAHAMAKAFAGTCLVDTHLLFVIDERDAGGIYAYPHIDRATTVWESSSTMVEALNLAATKVAAGTDEFGPEFTEPPFAIAFMGDDHLPRTVGWDAAYLDALREMGTGIVYGNDLLQGARLPTQVAMTSDIVRALGYMAPPSLTHLYVDNFWLDLGRRAACLRYLPDVIVEHRHPIAGKAKWDEGYRRVNDSAMNDRDQAAYAAFVEDGFDAAADRVRMILPPMQWQLFAGDSPFVATAEFHRDRDRAPHLEQADHRARLLAAADLVAMAADQLDHPTASDLGCGDGGLLSLLTIEAWGYDFQPSNEAGWVERAVTATALDVFGADRDRVAFGDISVMTEVLEHIADPPAALRWVAEHSRFIVASSPRFESAARHIPEHAWAWNEAGFARLFESNGWTVRRHEMVGASQVILAEAAK